MLSLGNGNPLPCSCLEKPMDRGIWQAAVYGVAESDTQIHTHTHAEFTGMIGESRVCLTVYSSEPRVRYP